MRRVFIVFSGIDGSGKSSILNGVQNSLEQNGLKTSVQWLRFHHVLCKPLHAVARLLGLARKQKMTEGGEWRHEFYRSPLFCRIYLWATYFDTMLGKRKAFRRAEMDQSQVVICDRWIPDILIDLAVKCRKLELLHGAWARRFLALLPEATLLLCISRPKQALLDCRTENREDSDFLFRLECYEDWQKTGNTVVIQNDTTLECAIAAAQDKVMNYIKEIKK